MFESERERGGGRLNLYVVFDILRSKVYRKPPIRRRSKLSYRGVKRFDQFQRSIAAREVMNWCIDVSDHFFFFLSLRHVVRCEPPSDIR